MSKNNLLIEAAKQLKRESNNLVPEIYACIAIALHREYGFGYERINKVFVESQHIWENFTGNISEMFTLCEKETGIKLGRK